MNLRTLQLIALRDFWAIVQTKSFLLGLLAFGFIASVMPGVALLSMISDTYRVGVVDPLGAYRDGLAARYAGSKDFEIIDLTGEGAEAQNAALWERELFALVQVLPGKDGAEETFRISTVNLADPQPHTDLVGALTGILREQRAARMGVSGEQLGRLMEPLHYETLYVQRSSGARTADQNDRIIASAMPIIIVFSLFGLISFQSERLLTALMEEKMKRLLEVILTRATIYEVLLGKMLGILYVGLILYAGVGLLLGLGAALFGALHVFQPKVVIYYTMAYVTGYYLYAGFYASIGASCGNPKDAENLSMPLRMLLVIPIMISLYVNRNPEAPASVFFSYFPLTSPFVMTNRMMVSEVSWGSLALATALVVAGGTAGLWAAAQIFRASLLAQGRTLRLRDIRQALRGTPAATRTEAL